MSNYLRQQYKNGVRVKRPINVFYWLIGLVVVLVVVVVITMTVKYNSEDVHAGCKVTDKYVTITGSGNNQDTQKRVNTDNCGVFIVEDATLKGNFHSADTYASIRRGHTYDFTTIGWRVPFLSMFPDIIDAQPS